MPTNESLTKLHELAPELGLDYDKTSDTWAIGFSVIVAVFGGNFDNDAQDILTGRCRRLIEKSGSFVATYSGEVILHSADELPRSFEEHIDLCQNMVDATIWVKQQEKAE